jgi:hypothetical protein
MSLVYFLAVNGEPTLFLGFFSREGKPMHTSINLFYILKKILKQATVRRSPPKKKRVVKH